MTEAMDAIELLLSDHRKVEVLFGRAEKARSEGAQATIVRQICDELTIHMMIEEEVFYSALRGKIDNATIDEAIVEHDNARVLIRDLLEAGPDEDYYAAKVKVLKEDVEHHVKEEEEKGGAFDQARRSGVDLDVMGWHLAARKSELLALVDRAELPMPEMTAIN